MNDANSKKVMILTEGGKRIGTGHITRCISLYQAFEEQGITPEIIVNGDGTVKDLFSNEKHQIFNWTEDPGKIFNMISRADIMIIDSYLADIGFYEEISEIAAIPVYLDDTIRMDYPKGIVINGGVYAEEMDYKPREDITYLLGPSYTPLRKEFRNVPEKEIRKGIESVMITFGGDDMRNMTSRILRLLIRNHPELTKNVVIGNGFQNIKEIERISDKKTNLIYFPDAEVMKKTMLESDIAICAGGQTLYELARVGVPAIVVAVADNQVNNVKGWQEAGFIEYAGWWEDKVVLEKVEIGLCLLKENKEREKRSIIGRTFVDGLGARRIVQEIMKIQSETSVTMNLRGDFELGDILLINFLNLNDKEKEIVREMRNHDDVKKWMYSDHIISNEEHARFIEGLKKDNKNIYWLARYKSGGYPGVISLNRVDISNKNAYLGIYTNPCNVKRGAGYVLIECLKVLAFAKADLHTLKLEVIENNKRAVSFYKKAGFCEEGKLRDFVFKDGRWSDVIVMGIINKNVGQTWNSE